LEQFDLPGIAKLISEREAQARALDRDEWNAELKQIIAEGKKRQAAEQERGTLAGGKDRGKTPKPERGDREENLGTTAAGIRLAYSLTQTGQEFADALEDRGYILARVSEADAERLASRRPSGFRMNGRRSAPTKDWREQPT
jgi:hypothetical protein